MVHQKIWDSDQFTNLPIVARLLFIALITSADDNGWFRADPAYLNRKIFHADRIGSTRVQKMLEQMEKTGLITITMTEQGTIGFLPKWKQHQSLKNDRPKISDFPELIESTRIQNGIQMDPKDKLSKENILKDKRNEVDSSSAFLQNPFMEKRNKIFGENTGNNQNPSSSN